jgi:hypothetical protein
LRRLISFSLYGSDPKYIHGAIENAQMIRKLGPNWRGVFYVSRNLPEHIAFKLQSLGAIVLTEQEDWHPNGMFWRFNIVQDFDFDFALVRDTDSRILKKELLLLDRWFSSGKTLHIIRDHPNHSAVILGGLWGVSHKVKKIEIDWSASFAYDTSTGQDQDFLRAELWPKLKNSVLEHDSFHYPFSFFTKRDKGCLVNGFIGEAFDQNGDFDKSLRREVIQFRRRYFARFRKSLQLHRLKLRT